MNNLFFEPLLTKISDVALSLLFLVTVRCNSMSRIESIYVLFQEIVYTRRYPTISVKKRPFLALFWPFLAFFRKNIEDPVGQSL